MSRKAQLIISDQADNQRHYLIDCPWSYTETAAPPETVAVMGDDAIARVALFRHGLECQRCDTRALWERLEDAPISEEEARHVGQQMRAVYARGVRN